MQELVIIAHLHEILELTPVAAALGRESELVERAVFTYHDSLVVPREGAQRPRVGRGAGGRHVRVAAARRPHVQRALVRHAAHQRAGRVELYTKYVSVVRPPPQFVQHLLGRGVPQPYDGAPRRRRRQLRAVGRET